MEQSQDLAVDFLLDHLAGKLSARYDKSSPSHMRQSVHQRAVRADMLMATEGLAELRRRADCKSTLQSEVKVCTVEKGNNSQDNSTENAKFPPISTASNGNATFVHDGSSEVDTSSEDDLHDEVVSREGLKATTNVNDKKICLRRRRRLLYSKKESASPRKVEGETAPTEIEFRQDLPQLMKQLIAHSKAEATKSPMQTEISQLFRGFTRLDSNRDGFITLCDLEHFFQQSSVTVESKIVQDMLWSIDEKRRGSLSFEDVEHYYFRITDTIDGWSKKNKSNGCNDAVCSNSNLDTDATSVGQNQRRWLWVESLHGGLPAGQSGDNSVSIKQPYGSRTSPSKPQRGRIGSPRLRNLKIAPNVAKSHEKLFLFRLLLFATFCDEMTMEVHLLSALQELIRLYGRESGELRFQVIFAKDVQGTRDIDRYSVGHYLTVLRHMDDKVWERKT